jgi:hypothetical protein
MFPIDDNSLQNPLEDLENLETSDDIESIQELDFSFRQAISILRFLGYALLLFTLFDLADTLTPLQLMNPNWEFQTIGALVEKVVVPLMGFVLIFTGAMTERRRWEMKTLGIFSWLALIVGLIYCLMVPLGIVNTIRINEINKTQVTSQLDKQTAQIKQVQTQLSSISNEQQLKELLSFLEKGGIAITPKPGEPVETVKKDLKTFMTGAEERLNNQAKEALSKQSFDLIKRSVKWNIGALIAGVWFIGIWRMTDWARR